MFCYPEDSEGCSNTRRDGSGEDRSGWVGTGGGEECWHASLKLRKHKKSWFCSKTCMMPQALSVRCLADPPKDIHKVLSVLFLVCAFVLLNGRTPCPQFQCCFCQKLFFHSPVSPWGEFWGLSVPTGTFSPLHGGSLELSHSETGTLNHLWLGWFFPGHSCCSGSQLWLLQTYITLTYILYIYIYIHPDIAGMFIHFVIPVGIEFS